ncbi:MAG: type VI secretion system tip protein TssI/VgrG [Polyangiales bacterium]
MNASALFSMDAGPFRAGELRVVGFRGREAVSRPYRWDVTVDVADVDHEAVEAMLLGARASLSIPLRDAAPRVVHGVIASVAHVDVAPDGLHLRLRLRVVPRLWLLSRNRVSRVFQDMTASEVVAEVLGEAGVPFEARLAQRCPRRIYCVQYEESDLAFVTRLLAEEGIFYFFRHPPVALSDARHVGFDAAEPGELLVLADHAAACPPIASEGAGAHDLVASIAPPDGSSPPALYLHHGEGMVADEHHVSKLARERAVRPQAVLIRDYDFRRPSVDLTAAQTAAPLVGGATVSGEDADFTEVLRRTLGAVTRGSIRPDLPPASIDAARAVIYEHHGEDEDPEVNRPEAQIRLEQHRRNAVTARGEGWCRRLTPGHRFRLENHPDAALNAEYTVTEVRYVGRTSGDEGAPRAACEGSFTCVPAWAAPRPARPRRVQRQVLETARVTGPAGEEVHTDAHGRVKVQFHWDLQGRRDDRSSCWLRAAQAWAGAHWGAQFIPRVGMEVLVGFLGGDQDRPVVLGCLYNGENPPAFATPEDRTRSGFRTHSAPGGGGHNELSFEDAKGAEQVFLRAERDLDEVVRRDHTARVGRDERVVVDRDQDTRVEGNRAEHVAGARVVAVAGESSLSVRRSHTETVGGSRARSVGGDDSVAVAGCRRVTVAGDLDRSVEGDSSVAVGGSLAMTVRGSLNLNVGSPAGGGDVAGDVGVAVEGAGALAFQEELVVEGRRCVVIRSGDTRVEVTPDGVRIVAKRIELSATEAVSVHTGDAGLELDDDLEVVAGSVCLHASGSRLELKSEAALKGTKVHLAQGAGRSTRYRDDAPSEAVFHFARGRELEPLGGLKVRIRHPDGSVKEHVTDADGYVRIPGAAREIYEVAEVVDGDQFVQRHTRSRRL